MTRNRSKAGFTLIELLVVISIILLLVSMTVASFVGLIGSSKVTNAAVIIQNLFDQTSQLARTEKVMLFLVITDDKTTDLLSVITTYRDNNDNGIFDSNVDKPIENRVPIFLPGGVEFYHESEEPLNEQPPMLFGNDPSEYWIGFSPYGSLVLPEGVKDVPFFDKDFDRANADPTQPNIVKNFSTLTADAADLVVWDKGTSKRVLMDFFKESSKIRKPILITK